MSPILLGDFDHDGVLSLADIDTLTAAVIDQLTDERFDLDGDGTVDASDHTHWVKVLRNTWIGDTNLDGQFNSSDLITVFQGGRYEVDADAGWSEGDWTGDLRFDTADLIAALEEGGYEVGPRPAVSAVPEPAPLLPAVVAALTIVARRQRRRVF